MTQLLDTVEIDLVDLTVYIDVHDHSLSRKWLAALNSILKQGLHLEKNYCFLGFPMSARGGAYLCEQINHSIAAINRSAIGYTIDDHYDLANTLIPGAVGRRSDGSGELPAGSVEHAKFNQLHRYFEDLQGTAAAPSALYTRADPVTRWHIRQLNLLCHEFESWALSAKKAVTAPEWVRPSQLMCWLGAPRFELEPADLEAFGIETLNRPTGAVYVGVNKGVGKSHWEVFVDEAQFDPDHRMDQLTTGALGSQLIAAADFDIEWGCNPEQHVWQQRSLGRFRTWLIANGLDPQDKSLTIGHPKVAQVDLQRSFGTEDCSQIWHTLSTRLDVSAVRTSTAAAEYPYHWADPDYMEEQIKCLG
jgi:hypothetical protein